MGPALPPCLCSAAPTCALLFALPGVSGLFLPAAASLVWADGWSFVAPWSLRVCPACLPCALCRSGDDGWSLAAPQLPVALTPSRLALHSIHFSHLARSLSWRARLTASRVFFTWLASASPSRHTRSTCKRRSATSLALRSLRLWSLCPPSPLVAEPSAPGPDRVEVEVHSPPLVFPRGSVVGLASKSRPAVPPSLSHSPPAQTLRANAAAGHARETASSPRGPGLQGRLSPSPATVHSRQRVCSRCRQVGGASHDSPAASAVKVSVEDGVLSRGTTTK